MPAPSPISIPALLDEIDLKVFENTDGAITEPIMRQLLKLITVSLRQFAQNLAGVSFQPLTITASADNQTVFAFPAGLPTIAVPKFVHRFRLPAPLDPDNDYTVDPTARTITLNVGDLPTISGEKLLVLFQTSGAATVGQAAKFRLNAGNLEVSTDGEVTWDIVGAMATINTLTKVANVAAVLAGGNDTFAYTTAADDGSITEVRKVGGQVYESPAFIPYSA